MVSNMDNEKYSSSQPLLRDVELQLDVVGESHHLTEPHNLTVEQSPHIHVSKTSIWYLHGLLLFIYSTIFLLALSSILPSRSHPEQLLPRKSTLIYRLLVL